MGSISPATALVLTALVLSGCGNTASTTEKPAATHGSASTKPAPGYPTQTKNACDILTQEVAKSLLGSVADASRAPAVTRSADLTVSTCARANAAADLKRSVSVSLLLRAAQTKVGATSNEMVFAADALPAGATVITGYGDKAFWNPGFGQLNILRRGNWYILSSGSIDPEKHTLAQTRKLADAILDQL